MAVKRSVSSHLRNQSSLKHPLDYNFPIQITPPLSLQQYARSIAPLPGAPEWIPTGLAPSPPFPGYLSPETRRKSIDPQVKPWIYAYQRKYSIPTYTLHNYKDKKPKVHEPIWHLPGPYLDRRPTSLSPEKIPEKHVHEPLWYPPGHPLYKPVPFFDPPSLRWSLQELLKSTPDLRTTPVPPSRNTLVTKSQ